MKDRWTPETLGHSKDGKKRFAHPHNDWFEDIGIKVTGEDPAEVSRVANIIERALEATQYRDESTFSTAMLEQKRRKRA